MREVEIGMMCFEGVEEEPRNVDGPWKWERARKWIHPLEPPRGTNPVDILTSAK